MTVAELVASLLSRFDQNMRVVVAGFDESGIDDPKPPYIIDLDDGTKAVMIDFKSDPILTGLKWDLHQIDLMITAREHIIQSRTLEGRVINDDQTHSKSLELDSLMHRRDALTRELNEQKAKSEGAGGQL